MSKENALIDMQIESLEKIIKYKNEQIHLLAERNETQAKFLEFFEANSPILYKQMLDYFLSTDDYEPKTRAEIDQVLGTDNCACGKCSNCKNR